MDYFRMKSNIVGMEVNMEQLLEKVLCIKKYIITVELVFSFLTREHKQWMWFKALQILIITADNVCAI